MEEWSACKLSGDNALQTLADVAAVAATSSSSDVISSTLKLVGEMFGAEGAILWLLNDEQNTLELKQAEHFGGQRSPAFEGMASEKSLKFGQALAGRAWAEGQYILFEQSAVKTIASRPLSTAA